WVYLVRKGVKGGKLRGLPGGLLKSLERLEGKVLKLAGLKEAAGSKWKEEAERRGGVFVAGPEGVDGRKRKKGEREEEGEEEKEGKGGKRRMKLGVVRSRNRAVDKWLGEEDVRVGEDGFGDLEDFLV
ncbi:hypothetical protein TrRE_jg12968, partial [Triparma retinervis]